MFVGFLLGARFRLSELKAHGFEIISIAIAKVVVSAVVVGIGLINGRKSAIVAPSTLNIIPAEFERAQLAL